MTRRYSSLLRLKCNSKEEKLNGKGKRESKKSKWERPTLNEERRTLEGRRELPTLNFERPTLNILILLNVGCSKFYANMVLRTVSCVDETDLQSFVFCGIVT